jgi:hypothetical protein
MPSQHQWCIRVEQLRGGSEAAVQVKAGWVRAPPASPSKAYPEVAQARPRPHPEGR